MNDISARSSRKLDHIHHTLALGDGPANSRFADFQLLHNCLPELALTDVKLNTSIAGIALQHPLIINAITGGTEDVTAVNMKLAEIARETGTAMALGSQFAALRQPASAQSYQIVRKTNPHGVIFANLGAHATIEQAKTAVEMVEAAALQIHLNPSQELMMPEGDRDFTGYLENLSVIAKTLGVSVIAKETGNGIASEQAKLLVSAGVKAIDIGGSGGTNFLAIEAARGSRNLPKDELAWGIPTAISAAETATVLPQQVDLVVSGGVRTPLDAVKSLVLCASAVAVAGPLLRLTLDSGVKAAVEWIEEFLADLRRLLLLIGCSNPLEARSKPIIVTGFSREWLQDRGIDTSKLACKGMRERYER